MKEKPWTAIISNVAMGVRGRHNKRHTTDVMTCESVTKGVKEGESGGNNASMKVLRISICEWMEG